jgi:hypothetical protein
MPALTARKGDDTVFNEEDLIETGDDGAGAKTISQKTSFLKT